MVKNCTVDNIRQILAVGLHKTSTRSRCPSAAVTSAKSATRLKKMVLRLDK